MPKVKKARFIELIILGDFRPYSAGSKAGGGAKGQTLIEAAGDKSEKARREKYTSFLPLCNRLPLPLVGCSIHTTNPSADKEPITKARLSHLHDYVRLWGTLKP